MSKQRLLSRTLIPVLLLLAMAMGSNAVRATTWKSSSAS